MADEPNRLDQLEKDVQALKTATATRTTPIAGIAAVVALGAFILIVAKVPLPGNPPDGTRWGIGCAAGFAGFIVAGMAAGFAKFALRALVEIAVVSVFFLNAVAAVVAWISSAYLRDLVSLWNVASGENALPVGLGLAACTIFAVHIALMLLLYPLAKVAGSDVLD